MKQAHSVYLNFFSNVAALMFQHRLLLLSLLILARYTLEATSGGRWAGDFWEHSAVVNEFMIRPFSPLHPQLSVQASHAFLNPYGFSVAMLALATQSDAINTLAAFGVLNFTILVIGLRQFIATVDQPRAEGITFYTLLLAMFLWGKEAWQFSGFYNVGILNDVLPYPSTLALGLSLCALAVFYKNLTVHAIRPSFLAIKRYSLVSLIAAVVLLIHPLTALFLWIGLVSLLLAYQPTKLYVWLSLGLTVIVSIGLATCWPFFSILQLIFGAGAAYHPSNASMYLEIIQGTWPILLTLPLIIWRAALRPNRAITLAMLALLALYVWGYYSRQYSFGRSIAFLLLLSNVLVAQCLIEVERWPRPQVLSLIKASTAAALCVAAGVWLYQSTSRLLTVANSLYLGRPIASQISYRDLIFLKDYVQRDDVVLADIESSWKLPTLAGKAVATQHPLAFVPDWFIRKEEVIEFFSANSTAQKRAAILKKYQPQYLLIKKSEPIPWQDIVAEFAEGEQPVMNNDNFILLRLQH
jgi:hypothetical protein